MAVTNSNALRNKLFQAAKQSVSTGVTMCFHCWNYAETPIIKNENILLPFKNW